jgi:molecular chaperone DnaJ
VPGGAEKCGVARDLYEVLGVRHDADPETIKAAYRALARELHPDVAAADIAAERFREVAEAYAVLSDERSRRLYDRLGWRGRGGGLAPRRGVARIYASDPRAFVEDLESVIASAVGRRPAQAPEPTRVVGEVELDAYEAHVGARRSVEVPEPQLCLACGGTGRRRAVSQRDSGRFLALNECPACGGKGETEASRSIRITIPPRSQDRDRIPVAPDAVAVVRIVPPPQRLGVRIAALAGFLAAVAFLLYLLSV